MCRNIKTLFNFEPTATETEIRAAALQFVRKVSGFNQLSKTNEAAFLAAVDQIVAVTSNLLSALETNAPPKRWPGREYARLEGFSKGRKHENHLQGDSDALRTSEGTPVAAATCRRVAV